MPITLSSASLPAFQQILGALDAILDKVEAHATARKIAPEVLLQARLYPDMFHFTRQVQITCDFAMRTVARLSGLEPLKLEDHEKTVAELKKRIKTARDHVAGADTKAIDAAADRDITFPMGPQSVTMKGAAYLTHFALPNFYFHATTAYAILRENGVELGKRDFMGQYNA